MPHIDLLAVVCLIGLLDIHRLDRALPMKRIRQCGCRRPHAAGHGHVLPDSNGQEAMMFALPVCVRARIRYARADIRKMLVRLRKVFLN